MTVSTTDRSLSVFLAELRADLAAIPGLKRAYQGVPDSINELPAIVVQPSSGTFRLDTHGISATQGTAMGVHTVVVQLYIPRKDMPRDMELIETFIDVVPLHILQRFMTDDFRDLLLQPGDPLLANNATAPFRYGIVPDQYAGQEFRIYELEFDVAIQQEVPHA